MIDKRAYLQNKSPQLQLLLATKPIQPMHKSIYLLLLVLTSFTSYSQIKATIQDSTTKEPIPYVNIWVEEGKIAISADENGNFSLQTDSSKTISFSAVGYNNSRIKASDINSVVLMKPQTIQLNEVVIERSKNPKSIQIGSLKNTKPDHYIAQREGYSWIFANYYPYKPEYKNTYFNNLKLITYSEVKGAIFNIRLYSVNEKGEPGDYLYDDNIICEVKKGEKTNTIDFSKYNIRFPENGIFIALEWLTIEKNKYKTITRSKINEDGTREIYKKKDREIYYMYAPNFGVAEKHDEYTSWISINGKWSQLKPDGKLHSPILELLLTN